MKEIDLVPTFHPRAFGMNRNRKWNVEVIGQEKNGGGIGTAKCMFIQLKIVLYCFKRISYFMKPISFVLTSKDKSLVKTDLSGN